MKIFAVDPGLKTGWAWYLDGIVESGVQDFGLKRGESKGMRFFNFRVWLELMLHKCRPDIVIYEMSHHRGGYATELLVGLVTRIQEVCDILKMNYRPVHSAALKKAVTGKGNTKKEEMLTLARKKWGDDIIDDNEADARWLIEWAKAEYGLA